MIKWREGRVPMWGDGCLPGAARKRRLCSIETRVAATGKNLHVSLRHRKQNPETLKLNNASEVIGYRYDHRPVPVTGVRHYSLASAVLSRYT